MVEEKFDLVVIDSPYNYVNYGLQHAIEKLRSKINTMAGIIITNHTKKYLPLHWKRIHFKLSLVLML